MRKTVSLLDATVANWPSSFERDAHTVGALDGRAGQRRDEAEGGVDHGVVGLRTDAGEVGRRDRVAA